MSSTSREYATFKRLFVGPRLPRRLLKIIKPTSVSMPAEKPIKISNEILKDYPKVDGDWRCTKFGTNIKPIATPQWANKDKIKLLYSYAKQLTEETGIEHQVDHIIPLRHPLVCGLHVEHNLQILSKSDNITKSNNFSIT